MALDALRPNAILCTSATASMANGDCCCLVPFIGTAMLKRRAFSSGCFRFPLCRPSEALSSAPKLELPVFDAASVPLPLLLPSPASEEVEDGKESEPEELL